MLELLDNKYTFLNLKPKQNKIFRYMFLIILILLIISFKVKVYDNYLTKGYITCNNSCTLKITFPAYIDYQEIYLDGKKLNGTLISSSIISDSEKLLSYKEVVLSVDLEEEKVGYINIFYNNERLIKKIYDLFF